MKAWTGTVVVHYYQDITVEAETREQAEMQMYEQFDISKAGCSECQAYDIEEVKEKANERAED
jgi:hypothetical protein